MKKQMFLLAILFCRQLTLFSQFSVSGSVKDENGTPLVGANVLIQETFTGATTNQDGNFHLAKVKTGRCTLVVSFIGYETEKKEILVDKDLNISFQLISKALMADEVIVLATRASDRSPVARSTVSREEIGKQNLGQDVPYLLSLTPSLVTSSDAGTGVGYTSFRIRGTDLSRINVTVNGIPLNDAESHGVWWVDLPDFASSVENIQVQRGVGTSSLGGGAFGATINLQTLGINKKAYSEINNSYGSFNTLKNSVSVGSGLIHNHFTFDARLSRISSDGFIDRGWSKLKSYYVSGAYYTGKTIVKLNIFSGWEQTYQAWDGIPGEILKTNRTYNGLGEYTDALGNTKYYDNQTDNYQQDHYQLIFSHALSSTLNFNTALHYTRGLGYYEQYKAGQKFKNYNLNDVMIGNDTVRKTDLIRRKWLDNDFYGATWALNYSGQEVTATLGGGLNQYDGRHYGRIRWAQYMSNGEIDHQYYHSDGVKTDFNIFAKGTWQVAEKLSVFGDIQYRNVTHDLKGEDDNHRDITQEHSYDFFNPKTGLTYRLAEGQDFYAYFGIAHREPTRTDFVDSDPAKPAPKAEMMKDYELGYNLKNNFLKLSVNGYFMDYKDQLVLTGEINDVGSAIMSNVKDSYRAGVEFSASAKVGTFLTWDFNTTFSKNVIRNFTSYVDNWDYWNDPSTEPYQYIDNIGTTKLSFSPEIITGNQLDFRITPQMHVALISKYVGKQYIDNTQSEQRKLNAYQVHDVRFNWKFKARNVSNIETIVTVRNIFNAEYETNAWVYQYMEAGQHKVLDGYFPQAGINFMAGLIIAF